MKKLLLTILCAISSYSYAEINTKVYNNYIALSEPEYAPHSTLIKHQEISFDINNFSRSEYNRHEILSYHDGLIRDSYSEKMGEINIHVDYETKSITNSQGDGENFIWIDNFVFDKNKGFQKILSYPKKQFSYDSNNKLNKIDSIGDFSHDITSISYTNTHLVKLILTEVYTQSDFSIFKVKTKEFIYDNDGKLIEIIQKSNKLKEKDKSSIIHCYFTEHNKYGDWIKGNCDNGDYEKDIKRTIEYWE